MTIDKISKFTPIDKAFKKCVHPVSPIILQRKTAIPTYERNSLVLNLSTDISKVTFNNVDNTLIVTFDNNDGGSIEFNNREYNLQRMYIINDSGHKITTEIPTDVTQIPSADLEIILQCENKSGASNDPDFLNVSILVKKGGNEFDKTNSFFNQLFGSGIVATATKPSTKILPNGVNLYDVLPKNRSYYSYSGQHYEQVKGAAGSCYSKNPVQWVIFENVININSGNEFTNIETISKKGAQGGLINSINTKAPVADQLVFYKSDKDSTLAGMASGDIKYVKCSRKLRNDDPDMYDKYLYNRKKKDDKCDNILQLNNDLEKQYDKILDDKSDLNPLSMLFFGAGDENTYEIIMSTATYIFLFCITLLISFYIVRIMVSLLVPAASATNILVNPKDTFNKMKSAVSSPK
jgi:carbonic anhydrase